MALAAARDTPRHPLYTAWLDRYFGPGQLRGYCTVAAGRPRAALLMQAPFKYQKTTSRIAFRDLDAMLRLFA